MKEKIKVGKITNAHGLRGDMRVYPYTNKENFEDYSKLLVEGIEDPMKVSKVRFNKNMVLLKFNTINHIDEVEPLKNRELFIYKEDLKELEDDEFYISDIIGCTVESDAGEKLGLVKEYLTNTSQAVIVVKGDDGKEFMVPHVDAFVVSISIEDKLVVMKLIEGLIE